MKFPLFSRRQKTRTPRGRRTPSRNRPSVEILEARELLALNFLSQPLDTASGEVIKSFQVQSISGAGAITVSLTEQSSSGTPILGGTVTQPTKGGIATFNDLYVYGGTVTDGTLIATAGSDLVASAPFQIKAGGDHLSISSTIPTTAAGASLGTITVQELDGKGTVEMGDSTTQVQLTINNNPGGAQFRDAKTGEVITTPITATLVNGVATFTSPKGNPLALDRSGIGYTLGVQAINNSVLLPATSNAFVISAGAPAGLAFQAQPTFTSASQVINEYNRFKDVTWTGIVVEVVDKWGNQVLPSPTQPLAGSVTLALAGPSTQLNGKLTQNIDANTGVASFTDLAVVTAGDGYTLRATGTVNGTGFATPVASNPFNVGANRGPLVYYVDPTISTTIASVSGKTITVNPAAGFPGTNNFMIQVSQPGQTTQDIQVLSGAGTTTWTLDGDASAFGPGAKVALSYALPHQVPLGATMPTVKVAVTSDGTKIITDDNTDSIFLDIGAILGTKIRRVQNGIATFDDLIPQGVTFDPGKTSNVLPNVLFFYSGMGGLPPSPSRSLTEVNGAAYNLLFENPAVGVSVNNGPLQVTAGTAIKDNAGQDLKVDVVDQFNNRVLADNTDQVILGVLPTAGRGAVFVGQSTNLGDPTQLVDYVTATAQNGVVTFPNLYMNLVGQQYKLAASTTTFGTHSLATTNEFDVIPGAAKALQFGNTVDTTTAGLTLNGTGVQPITGAGVRGVVVQAVDAGGNVTTALNGTLTLTLVPEDGGPGTFNNTGSLTTTVKVVNGYAVLNQIYINQTGGPFKYHITASMGGLTSGDSNSFSISQPFPIPGTPTLHLTQIGDQTSGAAFNVTVSVTDGTNGPLPNTTYDAKGTSPANVTIELRDASGNPLVGGPVLIPITPNSLTQTLTNGSATFKVQINAPKGTPAPRYTILALLDLHAQTLQMASPFTVNPPGPPTKLSVTAGNQQDVLNWAAVSDPSVIGYDIFRGTSPGSEDGTPINASPVTAASFTDTGLIDGTTYYYTVEAVNAAGPGLASNEVSGTPDVSGAAAGASPNPIQQVGLGSLTTDFGTISSTPAYTAIPKPGERPYPPVDNFDQAKLTGTPMQQQPNVAPGFNQVPQSNKFWSSLMFPRFQFKTPTGQPDVSAKVPLDSQGNQLFPLFAGPFTAMVNSNASAGDFAGLGLSDLTDLFITPSSPTADPDKVPLNQYPVWNNQQFPGAAGFRYAYDGNSNAREYQDFSVGLQGVQADGKVLSYSDWTVTLDWQGKDASQNAQELQATLGEGLPFAYLTAPDAGNPAGSVIQLVTTPKNNPDTTPVTVTVTAFDKDGKPILGDNGVGPFELEISYSLKDARDNSTQTIDHFYGVFLPSTATWTLTKGANGNVTFAAKLTKDTGNYFSVATLPTPDPVNDPKDNKAFLAFLPHAYTFVTGSTSSFSVDQATSKVTTSYVLQTTQVDGASLGTPLQALIATQYNNLSSADQALLLTNAGGNYLSYSSPNGEMLLWNGPLFYTQLQYTGVLPEVPSLPGADKSDDGALYHNYLLPILQSVSSLPQADGLLVLNTLFGPKNNYLDAQSMYGAAQLVPILLEISQSGDPTLSANDKVQAANFAQQLYNQINDRMGSWLSASDDQTLRTLYYQPQTTVANGQFSQGWQSLMSILSGFGSSEKLNDHQLIAGYFIKVAAFLAQYDSTWGDTAQKLPGGKTTAGRMGDIVNLIIADAAGYNRSPSNDKFPVPFLRNFDVYAGHSWADGAANDNQGTNLESSSEALNFDAAVIQWGQAIGDPATTDLGVYLYTTELQAANTFWFSDLNTKDPKGNPTSVIPQQYLVTGGVQTRQLVTERTSQGGLYIGFIGTDTTNVTGIQLLPLSGSAYYLGQNPNVAAIYNLAVSGNTNPPPTVPDGKPFGKVPINPPLYLSVLYPYLALSDPKAALNLYTQNINNISLVNPGDLIDNNAFNVHWMEVLQQYGQVDATVHASYTDAGGQVHAVYSYGAFKNGTVRTFVGYNPDSFAHDILFTDAGGNVVYVMKNVAPRTEQVDQQSGATRVEKVAVLATPDYSLQTPQNRFFFTTDTGGKPTLTYGRTGAGTKPADPTTHLAPTATITNAGVQFTITGLTGQLLGPQAAGFFDLWLDPGFSASQQIKVTISYDQFGDGKNVITQTYVPFNVDSKLGFVEYRSLANGGLTGAIPPYFTMMKNGTVTVTLKTVTPGATVRLRTDAADAQGKVSFLDLPYAFTQVGGMSVAQLSLGGPVLSNAQPLVSADPPAGLQSPSSTHLPAFTANFNAATNTATFNAAFNLGTPQTLQITVDSRTGLLMNNRFAAGDAGFADAYDFGGGQHLQATAGATVIINDSYGYSVVLGANAPGSAASDLLAHIDVTSTDNQGTLTINDGAGTGAAAYTVAQDANGLEFTTDDGSLHVTDQGPGNVFGGGVSLITGLDSDGVHVLATQSGEGLTLDSLNPQEVAYVGDGNLQNVNGDVSVTNSAPGGTTSLYVDNGLGVNAVPGAVTISGTSIAGLAPATISYSNKRTGDVVIVGGSTSSTYWVTGSLGGSTLGLATGSGLDKVIVGNNGVVNDTFFPGNLNIQESQAQDRLDIDNSNGIPANVALTNRQVNGLDISVVNGLTYKPIQATGFATLGVDLGGSGNTFSANSTTASPANFEVTSAGDLTLAQSSLLGNNLDVSTTAGNVTVAGTIATGGGTISVHTPDANNIQVNQTINTGPGSGGQVRTGSNVSPPQPNALYVTGAGNILLNQTNLTADERFVNALYVDFLGRSGSLAELDFWVAQLPRLGQAGVAGGIMRSTEAWKRVVDASYLRFLGRAADGGEEMGWVNALSSGALTEEQVIADIFASPEFANHASTLFPGAPPDTAFIDALYTLLLNHPADAAGSADWLHALPSLGRAGVANAFEGSAEYRGGAVRTFYGDPTLTPFPYQPFFVDLMHRSAPPSSGEVSGWVNFGLDLVSIQGGFASSGEFFQNG
jgi:endoglucanase Acf2